MSCLFKNRVSPIEHDCECPICLEDVKFFHKKETLNCRCNPPRYFHKKCIKTWLKLKDVCPLCDSKVERKLGFWEKYFLGTEVFDPCDFDEDQIQNNIIERIEEVFREDELAREQINGLRGNNVRPGLQRDITNLNERRNRLEEQLARLDESMRISQIRRNIRRRNANQNESYSLPGEVSN